MAETAEKLGDEFPATDFQREEYARQTTDDAAADVRSLIQSGDRYLTALTGGQPAQPTAAPTAPAGSDLTQLARQKLAELGPALEAQRAAEAQKAQILGPEYERAARGIEGTQLPQRPQVPPPIPVPTREQFIDQTAAKSLFAVASMIAGLGMMGGRGRGMLAMAGMTGAMQGFTELNAEKYKAGMLQYKEAVNQQLDQYTMAHQGYLDDIQNVRLSWDQRLMALQLRAKALDDKIMTQAAAASDIDTVFKHINDLAKTENAIQNTLQKSLRGGARPTQTEYGMMLEKRKGGATTGNELVDSLTPQQAAERLQKGVDPFGFINAAPGQGFTPEGGAPTATPTAAPGGRNEAVLQGVKPQVAQMVRDLVDYRLPVPTGGFSSRFFAPLVSLANQYDPKFNIQEYQARQRMINDYSGPQGTAGLQIQRINTVMDHLAKLKQAGQELNNSQLLMLNKIINGSLQQTGDPRVDKFAVPAQAVASEIAGVLKGTRAAPTEQEIGEQRNIISNAKSPAQLDAIVKSSVGILTPRIQTLAQMWEDQFHAPRPEPILQPHSRAALQSIGIDPETIEPRGNRGGAKYPEGTIITNPATGERRIRKNGQWLPLNQ